MHGRLLVRCQIDGKDLGATLVSEGWTIATGDYLAQQPLLVPLVAESRLANSTCPLIGVQTMCSRTIFLG